MVNELCDLVLLRATARGATIQMRTATAAA
jgi:hypothetical protein